MKKKYGKIINIEHPGQKIIGRANEKRFEYEDGQIGEVPEIVVNILKEAISIEWKQVNGVMRNENKQRYMFVEMQRPEKAPEEVKKDELIEQLLENNPKAKRVKK